MLEEADFVVVGEAADGKSGIEEALRLDPDVIVLDIQLPDLDGFAVSARISAARLRATVVLVSGREGLDYGERLVGHAFIPKSKLTPKTLGAALAKTA
ncbi:MAG: two-component system, NarL family, nitrate/nitrite response regulator NarL [Actinomycetota bacterium]|nr:two-component system, NarL family, nitrate/nitrite response regulator NarL [Actinomycetota bacterium]